MKIDDFVGKMVAVLNEMGLYDADADTTANGRFFACSIDDCATGGELNEVVATTAHRIAYQVASEGEKIGTITVAEIGSDQYAVSGVIRTSASESKKRKPTLTSDDITRMCEAGQTTLEIAEKFGLSEERVEKIVIWQNKQRDEENQGENEDGIN